MAIWARFQCINKALELKFISLIISFYYENDFIFRKIAAEVEITRVVLFQANRTKSQRKQQS